MTRDFATKSTPFVRVIAGRWPHLEVCEVGLHPEPKVALSIGAVVPVHDNADVIETTLNSILENMRPCDRIAIVENGSTDDSWTVIHDRWSNHPQVVIHRLAEGDAAAARNEGIRLVGDVDFIAFCDGDDQWLPGRLDQVRAVLLATGADIVSQPMLTVRDDTVLIEGATFVSKRLPRRRTLLAELLITGNFLSTSALVLRRNLMPLPLFSSGLRHTQDYEAWCWFARHNPRPVFAYLDQPSVLYRWMGGLSRAQWQRIANVYRVVESYSQTLGWRERLLARVKRAVWLVAWSLLCGRLMSAVRVVGHADTSGRFRGRMPPAGKV